MRFQQIRGPSTSAGNQEYEEDEGKCNKVKTKVLCNKSLHRAEQTKYMYSWIL